MAYQPNKYNEYLQSRSKKALFYRNYYLYPTINFYSQGKILDVGCGIGDFLNFNKNAAGTDIDQYGIKYCKEQNLNVTLMKNGVIPYEDSSFDTIILDNVLEHISEPNSLLNEINRVLTNAGRVIIGVPGKKGFESDEDHKIFYDKNSLNNLMKKYGYHDIKYFYMPIIKSEFLSKNLRQYCIYGVFEK